MKSTITTVPQKPEFKPRTVLGKKLWARRQSYIARGGKLLDWDGLERELAKRKGKAR